MTYDQAIEFLRKVCAERIQSVAGANAIASAEALAERCELAFSVIKEFRTEENSDV